MITLIVLLVNRQAPDYGFQANVVPYLYLISMDLVWISIVSVAVYERIKAKKAARPQVADVLPTTDVPTTDVPTTAEVPEKEAESPLDGEIGDVDDEFPVQNAPE